LIAADDNRNRRMEGVLIRTFKLKFHGSPMYGRLELVRDRGRSWLAAFTSNGPRRRYDLACTTRTMPKLQAVPTSRRQRAVVREVG
jgi:hypothetical protein